MAHPSPSPRISCSATESQLQRFLDGVPAAALPTAFHEHLDTCSACRIQFHLARRMLTALAEQPAIAQPHDLTDRLLAAVESDREVNVPMPEKPRRSFFFLRSVAVAASLILVLTIGFGDSFLSRTVPIREGTVRAKTIPPIEMASNQRLKDRLTSAGSVLLQRTQKATSETIPSLPLGTMLSPRPDQLRPASTLDQVSSGASSTVQPIASSAKRAYNLFRREIVPTSEPLKPNS